MIEKAHLYELGYRIKTQKLHDGSSDFVHPDKRGFLVNYDNGEVHIEFPLNTRKETVTFNDPVAFKDWHEKQ